MSKKRVVVAMSGGVDSSVTAALLKERGYDVIGITYNLWPSEDSNFRKRRFETCCGFRARMDANQVAIKLNIPHYVADYREIFRKMVIEYFCNEYFEGKTPNPCIRCNQYIKFGYLFEHAKKLNADFIATGHYARIVYDKERKRYLLKKGIDPKKDQSYFLYVMTQEHLSKTLMPLGEFTKRKVREIARNLGLPVAWKAESQEICFVPDGNYPQFLEKIRPNAIKPGPIINKKGEILGQHKGIIYYTIGQRKGLGIYSEKPLYVISIDKKSNTIVVGEEKDVYRHEFVVEQINWILEEKKNKPFKAKVKIRYLHPEAEAEITPMNHDTAYVRFLNPQRAITPGQSAVFYEGDIVIGGGIIKEVKA
ncbi:tRNA 2-thiouridine(34) synthase MnmA [SCandidatus Aminicenantes bacterium Aminicenantia_JdfR_composite]|jgi:tRNA-specific 2-thiouridylase|nr:tRNA 2-thiouridine(34) synthase MnmA [SCandidatus Aminicenantes bacterium Aminicenantia_JdfR_composite]MCP2597598.1 tRNA 2-thiouridine(34) synthase MnmA [Candidatus Aminicenantes bacterium AC-335-G13]MCP2598790.1 tRNA 2-thiouridine(34) synthase MnmA [Candidatus Aminicenantes bacterium AC-335-L06]MCP2606599.1 tRNA 2-thiouridine(34) synthase MnmA [Candidatus Aminicenantes bacterium AC-708-I09]